MAVKDEYEVARLHSSPAFAEKLTGLFDGPITVTHHLAPPALTRAAAGVVPAKQTYGPWMRTALRGLAALKGLRDTPLDFFGRTDERREERRLITEYEACVDELLRGLTRERLKGAAEIARIPEEIRGYGHVKARHLKAARAKWDTLMAAWRAANA